MLCYFIFPNVYRQRAHLNLHKRGWKLPEMSPCHVLWGWWCVGGIMAIMTMWLLVLLSVLGATHCDVNWRLMPKTEDRGAPLFESVITYFSQTSLSIICPEHLVSGPPQHPAIPSHSPHGSTDQRPWHPLQQRAAVSVCTCALVTVIVSLSLALLSSWLHNKLYSAKRELLLIELKSNFFNWNGEGGADQINDVKEWLCRSHIILALKCLFLWLSSVPLTMYRDSLK